MIINAPPEYSRLARLSKGHHLFERRLVRGPRWGLLEVYMGRILLVLSVIKPEILMLTVIYEITVNCYHSRC